MPRVKIYISMNVYNYEASPRIERVKTSLPTLEDAFKTVEYLKGVIGITLTDNATGPYVEETFGISGYVDSINGIYRETTEKLA